jgi:hypothetical protein
MVSAMVNTVVGQLPFLDVQVVVGQGGGQVAAAPGVAAGQSLAVVLGLADQPGQVRHGGGEGGQLAGGEVAAGVAAGQPSGPAPGGADRADHGVGPVGDPGEDDHQ